MMQLERMMGIAAGVIMVGMAGSASADRQPGDERLEERVEHRLDDSRNLDHLNVDVDGGVVTLSGEVATRAEKTRAEKLARAAGARSVVNKIEVDPDKAVRRIDEAAAAKKERIDESAQRQKDRIDREAEAAKARAERRAEPESVRTNEPRRTVVPVERKAEHDDVIDPLVTGKVKTKILADDLLTGSDINVDTTSDGVVTLRGTVRDETARLRALEIARTTEGVRKVMDALEVRPAGR